jgi:hypothetical protein
LTREVRWKERKHFETELPSMGLGKKKINGEA